MSRLIESIPWDMIAPHGNQARINHGQTLERLANRGGLGPDEVLLILNDEGWDGRTFYLPSEREERARFLEEKSNELIKKVNEFMSNI